MNKIKYLVYMKGGLEHSIIFPALEGHDVMAKKMKADIVVGAGFCSFDLQDDGTLAVKCFGDSHSLNVKSREEDSLRVTLDYLGLSYEP